MALGVERWAGLPGAGLPVGALGPEGGEAVREAEEGAEVP